MLSNLLIEDIVRKTLQEDLGRGFDLTGNLLIPGDAHGTALLRTRQPGILCGLIPALTAFSLTDPDFSFEVAAQDGDIIQPGDTIARIEGPARALLTAERTALNFLIHLSGIATLTMAFVDEVGGTNARITCTRKTLPGLRSLQKYAVLTGGGSNHRFGLDDGILIKDNHIALAGNITDVLARARAGAGHMVKIEIEVDTLEQLEEVLESGLADVVMLDNFTIPDLEEAVGMAKGNIITEASGGITLATVRAIAETGVDYISSGALTHSAAALDMGLDVEI
ncbi:MAG: carboxylating nicotinate-nucleotide diphosphorylase [Alphaproteobacteria bacterium]|nr:carboxylating nicotinate-nucleotide diphosphorylase [Alphaproteobacteria bacterium]